MRILVTGSSGHLGEALIRVLQDRKIDFIGIDIKDSTYTSKVGSITDREFVRESMKGVHTVIHTATLHKPHVATHSAQDFVDTNVSGTLNLLEEAAAQQVRSFIYTSTTSTFGDTLRPKKGKPAIWITEQARSTPKNIYGVTKTAAEDLCQLFYRNHKLPCLILKVSRFFPEDDDEKAIRDAYDGENMKVNEFLHRRVDIEDAVSAHLLAVEKAVEIGFGKYIISATSPFSENDLAALRIDAPDVIERYYPEYKELYLVRNWKMLPEIDRVYVNQKARLELGWKPKYDFGYILHCMKNGQDYQSGLSKSIGVKGYHAKQFKDGPYPLNE